MAHAGRQRPRAEPSADSRVSREGPFPRDKQHRPRAASTWTPGSATQARPLLVPRSWQLPDPTASLPRPGTKASAFLLLAPSVSPEGMFHQQTIPMHLSCLCQALSWAVMASVPGELLEARSEVRCNALNAVCWGLGVGAGTPGREVLSQAQGAEHQIRLPSLEP